MRLGDWLLLALLFSILIYGKVDNGNYESPRRPAPRVILENESPQLLEKETSHWVKKSDKNTWTRKDNEKLFSNQLSKESTPLNDLKNITSMGTAFSIANNGTWLTAAHVVAACKKIAVQIGPNESLLVKKRIVHPKADLAILKTRSGPKGLYLKKSSVLSESFNVGFPRGLPGAVHAQFLGTTTLRHRSFQKGYESFHEIVNVWAEISRIPKYFGSLGGLSGGAVIDKDTSYIGVAQAENPRRGTIFTSRKETIEELLQLVKFDPKNLQKGIAEEKLNKNSYPEFARDFILKKSIAKVLCITS